MPSVQEQASIQKRASQINLDTLPDREYLSTYLWSARHGLADLFERMQKHPRTTSAIVNGISGRGYSSLDLSSEFGHTEIVRLAFADERLAATTVNKGSDSFDDEPSIHRASKKKHAEIVRLHLADLRLSAATVNMIECYSSPFINSYSERGNTTIFVEYLKDPHDRISIETLNARLDCGKSHLTVAAWNDDADLVTTIQDHRKFLPKTALSADISGNTNLITSADFRHTEAGLALLSYKYMTIEYIEWKNQDDESALSLAEEKNNKVLASAIKDRLQELKVETSEQKARRARIAKATVPPDAVP